MKHMLDLHFVKQKQHIMIIRLCIHESNTVFLFLLCLFCSFSSLAIDTNAGSIDFNDTRFRWNGHAFTAEDGLETGRRFRQREERFTATVVAGSEAGQKRIGRRRRGSYIKMKMNIFLFKFHF